MRKHKQGFVSLKEILSRYRRQKLAANNKG